MPTTPLWVPLVVAGIGVLGTVAAGIAGVLITQRRSDRRDDKTRERERQRERERWAREDEARTFEHRHQAYADFYESLKAMARTAYDHGYGFTDDPELPFDWQSTTFRQAATPQHLCDACRRRGRLIGVQRRVVVGAQRQARRPG